MSVNVKYAYKYTFLVIILGKNRPCELCNISNSFRKVNKR